MYQTSPVPPNKTKTSSFMRKDHCTSLPYILYERDNGIIWRRALRLASLCRLLLLDPSTVRPRHFCRQCRHVTIGSFRSSDLISSISRASQFQFQSDLKVQSLAKLSCISAGLSRTSTSQELERTTKAKNNKVMGSFIDVTIVKVKIYRDSFAYLSSKPSFIHIELQVTQ